MTHDHSSAKLTERLQVVAFIISLYQILTKISKNITPPPHSHTHNPMKILSYIPNSYTCEMSLKKIYNLRAVVCKNLISILIFLFFDDEIIYKFFLVINIL